MIYRYLRLVVLAAAAAAGCARGASAPSKPAIHLDTTDARQAVVEIVGLSRPDLAALSKINLTDDEWSAVLRVTVKDPQGEAGTTTPPVAGRYHVGKSVRFAPSFPLDPGREYEVVFETARLARAEIPRIAAVRAVVSMPRVERAPSTLVTAVYPSSASIPANQLRMYVEFSGPMGQQGGENHILLLDKSGREIVDAMLPLDTHLWNGDRTRYTVLFDPGRVKRDILPNRRMGRPLRPGETITLVVKADWPDATGTPLKSEFRRQYRVGPPEERPLDAAAWRIVAPAAGTRDPLRVTFPEPLDRALLQRALDVSRGDSAVPGAPGIEGGEAAWTFTPREPWQAGSHAVVISPILEDRAGNRIGRAFEVKSSADALPAEATRPISLPFSVAAGAAR
jgi:hypothetical protein